MDLDTLTGTFEGRAQLRSALNNLAVNLRQEAMDCVRNAEGAITPEQAARWVNEGATRAECARRIEALIEGGV